MRGGQRLFHTVLKARELSHRIVAAKEKEDEGEKLRRVHASGHNFALAEEEQHDDGDHADHLDSRWRKGCNLGGAQISADDLLRDRAEASAFVRFGAIGFDDILIGESFLRRVGQAFVALERFPRQIAQRASELRREDGDDGRDGERAERQSPVIIKRG